MVKKRGQQAIVSAHNPFQKLFFIFFFKKIVGHWSSFCWVKVLKQTIKVFSDNIFLCRCHPSIISKLQIYTVLYNNSIHSFPNATLMIHSNKITTSTYIFFRVFFISDEMYPINKVLTWCMYVWEVFVGSKCKHRIHRSLILGII